MTPFTTKKLGDFCVTGSGSTPSRSEIDRYYKNGTIPWIKSGELRESTIQAAEEYVTDLALKETSIKLVPAGAILLAMYGATVGRLGILGLEATTNQAVCHIVPDSKIADTRYIYHALSAQVPKIIAMGVGGAQPNINQGMVKNLAIPLPGLTEQKRIAAILDQADALRTTQRETLAQLDSLAQAIFIEMFGDPAQNPNKWPTKTVGQISTKFSDGPFGSNLKSSHYVENGIRVVRLQNIGVGKFIDEDKAYVSERHYEKLKKHDCKPGDVLIGTMGDPNLRACIQPEWLQLALNKADCVQFRPNLSLVTSQFVCALLNHPSTSAMAQDLMHGQTRVRISMGRLRDFVVPIPPLSKQKDFANQINCIEKSKVQTLSQLTELNTLFTSLQHRAFRGEL